MLFTKAELEIAAKVRGMMAFREQAHAAGCELEDLIIPDEDENIEGEESVRDDEEGDDTDDDEIELELDVDHQQRLHQVRRLREIEPGEKYNKSQTQQILGMSPNTLVNSIKDGLVPEPAGASTPYWVGQTLINWITWQMEDMENRKDRKNYKAARRRGHTKSYEEWLDRE